jgi:glycerophosphoryl diester phosphodiesterase
MATATRSSFCRLDPSNLNLGGFLVLEPTRRPEVIAHRGANREAPENSIAAFEAAIRLGAEGIELDVHVTADGVPVVHHDPRLPADGRKGEGPALSAISIGELRATSALPTLDEVIECVARRCRLYVEIKAPAALEPSLERLRPLRDACAVHSFDHRVIARASHLAPEVPRGILVVSRLVDPVPAMRAVTARDLWQHEAHVDDELIERVHRTGARLIAWTANDSSQAQAFAHAGVDALCTDALREMRALVDSMDTGDLARRAGPA